MENYEVGIEKVEYEKRMTLRNIYQFYLHDLSEYNNEDIDSMGLYDVEFLDMFWREEGLTAFFIKASGKIAGLILLQSGKYAPPSGEDYYISEYFVLRKYRRKGVAKGALKELFDLYPGKYMVGQLPDNKIAIEFWRNTYSQFGITYRESIENIGESKLICQRFEA